MSRYIDVDKAIDIIEELGKQYCNVAEVVYCRECKYYQDNNGGYPHEDCKWRENETPYAYDYCSAGERIEEE